MRTKDESVQTIQLTDGRLLAYAEYGDSMGSPLFFFHGSNDCRLQAAILHETARQMGVRVIAPDRPGYGRSTFQPNRTILDWPNDVAQLADALAISAFGIMGHSAGGPHTAAVAYALPERLTTITLISSIGPPGSSNKGMHPMFRMVNFFVKYSATLHRRITAQSAEQIRHSPDKFFAQWGKISKADGHLFQTQPELTDMLATEMGEAFHQGIAGILHEHRLYNQPWGFDLKAITVPVQLWHGLADPQAPPIWSHSLADQLPQAITHFIADEGHLSILTNHQVNILAEAIGGEQAA